MGRVNSGRGDDDVCIVRENGNRRERKVSECAIPNESVIELKLRSLRNPE
jgi:hypothetical protein